MVRLQLPHWIGRALLVVAGLALALGAAAVWFQSSLIRNEVLVPQDHRAQYDLTIAEIGGGRVVLPRTELTRRDGIWGIETETAYGQVGEIISDDGEVVERSMRTLTGTISDGDMARLDADAFPSDPTTAHGLGFEDDNYPGELGPQPYWLLEGRLDTWVVFVHGEGVDRRTQALRMIPILVEQGYPIAVVTYRNDEGAPASPDGLRRWGLEEWRDLDAAVETAVRKGATSIVLYGFDLGAGLVSMFLHESEHTSLVRGVVFDSPVLDLRRYASDNVGGLGFLEWPAQQLAAIRFGIEWRYLDQVSRADEFDVPVLLLHGAADPVAPFSVSEAFAAARPDLVELVRFEQGGHGDLWNIGFETYEAAVLDYLLRVADPE